jgi:DNA-binding NarL/FixJ family response regulator
MGTIHIMIVDDHKLFRDGLKLLLKSNPIIGEISEASSGIEFLELLPSIKPDVVIMDISMPGMTGIEATKKAIEMMPKLNIIALSMYADEEYYSNMIGAGAKAFLLKNADIEEVQNAIVSVCEGRNYFSQEIMYNLVKNINQVKKTVNTPDLTEREIEILYAICKGLSNQEIGDTLFISKRTVDKHRANILEKTNNNNTASLVMWAIKSGIVKL